MANINAALITDLLIAEDGLPEADRNSDLQIESTINRILLACRFDMRSGWQDWPLSRKKIAYIQFACLRKGIDAGMIDGLYGPQTDFAVGKLEQLLETGSTPRSFVDISPLNTNPLSFPIETESQLTAHYGTPGQVPLETIRCPWELRLDWALDRTTRKIAIHQKLANNLNMLLEDIYAAYGEEKIKELGLDRYGGSYNPRKKRGSATTWSTHAWGIAIDWFPSENRLRWRSDRARLALPEYDDWWSIWEENGWLSLGRTEDRDWMHVQAAKRR